MTTGKCVFSLLPIALLCAAPAYGQECATQRAVYEMADATGGQLVFERRDHPTAYSDLDIAVTAGDVPQRFGFHLTASNGYGNFYAIPDDESVSEDGLIVFFFQRRGDRLVPYEHGIPASGAPAPDALFMPGIGSALWYGTNGSENAVAIPTQIWYRASCR